MRVTENMRFNTTVYNLFNNQSRYNDIMEKVATQKKVNRASDDPIAAAKIIDIQRGKAAIEQYKQNMEFSNSWISASESTLSGAYDLLVIASGIASGSIGADAATREISAANIQDIIDSMRSLANTKWGDRYLFAGTREDVAPFPAASSAATIELAQKAAGNTFAGTVTSSGTYTGTVNKTYAVKIIKGGALGVATYQFSSDGGRTWNGPDFGTVSTATEGSGTVSQVIKGSVANTTDGTTPIVAGTHWEDIFGANAQNGTTFTITGKNKVGTDVSGSYTITDKTTEMVSGLLGQIAATFGAVATIDASGKITVTDTVGVSKLEMTLVGSLPMPAGGVILLGDGVSLTFNDSGGTKPLGANDVFYVSAAPAGYYQGNDKNLSINIDRGTNYEYSLTGSEVFTEAGAAGVDIFKALADLKTTLTSDAIANTRTVAGVVSPIIATTQITAINGYSGTPATDYILLEGTKTEASADGASVPVSMKLQLSTAPTVQDLLTAIVSTFGPNVAATVTSDGKLNIVDNTPGVTPLTSRLSVRIGLKNADDTDNSTINFLDRDKLISDQMTIVKNAQTQILLNQSLCGTKAGHIDVVKNNVTNFDESLSSLLSEAQDADIAELGAKMSVQQLALEMSYAMAAKIGETSILNYLK